MYTTLHTVLNVLLYFDQINAALVHGQKRLKKYNKTYSKLSNGNDCFLKEMLLSILMVEKFVGSKIIDCSSCSNTPVKLKVAITNP